MAKKQDSPSENAPGQQKKAENKQAIEAADERNALIAAWDEVNPGNRKSWKASRHEVEIIWGKDAVRGGKLRNGYEYRGLPIELED
jgi:hypothetical protein